MSQAGADFQTMNRQMVDRLSTLPAQPIPDGGYGLRVLDVAGRRSRRTVSTPIGVLATGAARFLVCPDRSRDWPQNLRVAGRATLRGGGASEDVTAHEITGRPAAEVVAAYLRAVTTPWAIRAFAVPDGATPAEIEPELTRMAVFRIDPVSDS